MGGERERERARESERERERARESERERGGREFLGTYTRFMITAASARKVNSSLKAKL